MPAKFNAFLNELPTTKVRILVSLGMSVYVIIMAVTKSYTPTVEILGFLLIQMGIDVTQYVAKQKTLINGVAPTSTPAPDAPPATTPVAKLVAPVVPTVPQTKPSDLG